MSSLSKYQIHRSKDDPSIYVGTTILDEPQGIQPSPLLDELLDGLQPQLQELWENREKDRNEVRYVQKFPDNSDDSYLCNFHFCHLGCRYWLKATNCTMQWFHETVEPTHCGADQTESPKSQEYVQHDFFAGDLVCMDEHADLILSGIEENLRTCDDCQYTNLGKPYSLRIYLEYLPTKTNKDTGLKFMKIYACRTKKLKGIFESLCGQKLKWEFSLSGILNFVPSPCAINGDVHIPSGQMENNFCREWQRESPQSQYFDLVNTHWYNWSGDTGSDLRDANWVSLHDTDVRLMCSPYWLSHAKAEEDESYQLNSPVMKLEENSELSSPGAGLGSSKPVM